MIIFRDIFKEGKSKSLRVPVPTVAAAAISGVSFLLPPMLYDHLAGVWSFSLSLCYIQT